MDCIFLSKEYYDNPKNPIDYTKYGMEDWMIEDAIKSYISGRLSSKSINDLITYQDIPEELIKRYYYVFINRIPYLYKYQIVPEEVISVELDLFKCNRRDRLRLEENDYYLLKLIWNRNLSDSIRNSYSDLFNKFSINDCSFLKNSFISDGYIYGFLYYSRERTFLNRTSIIVSKLINYRPTISGIPLVPFYIRSRLSDVFDVSSRTFKTKRAEIVRYGVPKRRIR